MPAEPILREVIEALEGIEREAGSPGERQAAEWLAARLEQAGARTTIDDVPYHHGFAGMLGRLSAGAAAAGAVVAATGKLRRAGALAGAGALALIADDISNGLRPWRKAVMEERTTTNVIAELGDPAAERTLVILGHHDAAHTGQIFDPTAQRLLGEGLPGVVERIDTSLPQWWGLLAGPAMVAAGSLTGRRKLAAAGALWSALGAARDGGHRARRDRPRSKRQPDGARRDGRPRRGPARAADPGAARDLRLLRSRGGPAGRDLRLLQRAAGGARPRAHLGAQPRHARLTAARPARGRGTDRHGGLLRHRLPRPGRARRRARADPDAARHALAQLDRQRDPEPDGLPRPPAWSPVNRHKALDNYHLPSDTSENVAYPTVAAATDLVEAVARELAAG